MNRRLPPPKKVPPPSRRLPPPKAPKQLSSQELGSGVLSQPSGCVPKKFNCQIHCIACSGSGISSAKTTCVPCSGTGRKKHGTY